MFVHGEELVGGFIVMLVQTILHRVPNGCIWCMLFHPENRVGLKGSQQ